MAEGELSPEAQREYNKLKAQQQASEKLAAENLKEKLNDVKDISGVIQDNLKSYANSLDKSGVVAELFGNKMSMATKATIATQAAFGAIVTAAFKADKSIVNLQKNLGVSRNRAFEFRVELSKAAFSANDLRVNTETLIDAQNELNKNLLH